MGESEIVTIGASVEIADRHVGTDKMVTVEILQPSIIDVVVFILLPLEVHVLEEACRVELLVVSGVDPVLNVVPGGGFLQLSTHEGEREEGAEGVVLECSSSALPTGLVT